MLQCYNTTVFHVSVLQCYSVTVCPRGAAVLSWPAPDQSHHSSSSVSSGLPSHSHVCPDMIITQWPHWYSTHHYFLVTQETIVKMYIKDLQEDDFEIALKVKMGITFLVKELTGVNKLSFVVSRFRLLFLKWSWQLTFHESVSIYQHIPTSNFYLMTRQSVLPSLQDWSYNYTDKMHKVFLHGCARADQ